MCGVSRRFNLCGAFLPIAIYFYIEEGQKIYVTFKKSRDNWQKVTTGQPKIFIRSNRMTPKSCHNSFWLRHNY